MPSCVLHNYFAKRVSEGLSSDIRKIIDSEEKSYLVGAQGPDLMFYLRYEKEPLNDLGNIIHTSFNTYKLFYHSGQYVKKIKSKSVLAFLFGQLCHYSLDANVHPYVYYREEDLPIYYTKGAHQYIHAVFESALDYICIRDNIKVNTRTYKAYKNLDIDKQSRKDIAKYYNKIIPSVYNMDLPGKKAEKTIKLMKKFMWLCDDVTGIRYLIIRGIEKFLGKSRNASAFIRPRNESKEENWLNHRRIPFPKYRYEKIMTTETMEEVYERAYNEAIILINNLFEFVMYNKDLDNELYYRNYTGERFIKNHKS